jgi:hypothetical protein
MYVLKSSPTDGYIWYPNDVKRLKKYIKEARKPSLKGGFAKYKLLVVLQRGREYIYIYIFIQRIALKRRVSLISNSYLDPDHNKILAGSSGIHCLAHQSSPPIKGTYQTLFTQQVLQFSVLCSFSFTLALQKMLATAKQTVK